MPVPVLLRVGELIPLPLPEPEPSMLISPKARGMVESMMNDLGEGLSGG